MQVNEELVRKVIEEVIAEFAAQGAPATPGPAPASPAGRPTRPPDSTG